MTAFGDEDIRQEILPNEAMYIEIAANPIDKMKLKFKYHKKKTTSLLSKRKFVRYYSNATLSNFNNPYLLVVHYTSFIVYRK